LDWEGIALGCSTGDWVGWVDWVEGFFYCSLSKFGDIVESVSWFPFEDLLYVLCISVAASIILNRPFPFVLMVGEILRKVIVNLGVKIMKNSVIIVQIATFRVHLQKSEYQLT
jgi:hypothetical protein